MTKALHAFQQCFADALARVNASSPSPFDAQPGFAIYRNTVMKAGIDTLEANYPSVARLVGRDWFRAAAALHVAASPPADGRLLGYGQAFADFLLDFEPATELPYLPDVARLDRFWTEAHVAADQPPLQAHDLALLPPEALAHCRLQPHPAARWAWFNDAPIYSIWSRNRAVEDADDEEIDWQAEGALITRPQLAVQWTPAARCDCAFLDACAEGCTLTDATECAAQADPQADLVDMLSRLMRAGALAAPQAPSKPTIHTPQGFRS
ncbi:DNA-binding domain-containing protein [Variovorax dokdonensis]|uniref:DNA-binding domain-containing protein n=1 Tax=Variovorax dokdonensis TaxID=344883 RepID=A0ABT7NCI7_9BURK|nr:DNA-binding domain-containing protein [Variovorax dokdonensis]MDM0045643.1 DNA-binding domain-containing protein [Variovorax dokdonensis]